MSPDDFDQSGDDFRRELSRFHDDFRPDPGIRPGLDSLPDGDFDFEVEQAEMVRTPEKKEMILRLALQVVGQPRAVEHVYFFRTQRAVNKLGWDLHQLGFDSDRWRADGRRFEDELLAAIPRLSRKRFTARKTSRKDAGGQVYHDLAIRAGVTPAPATPTRPGSVPASNGPALGPAPNASAVGTSFGSDEDIPF